MIAVVLERAELTEPVNNTSAHGRPFVVVAASCGLGVLTVDVADAMLEIGRAHV